MYAALAMLLAAVTAGISCPDIPAARDAAAQIALPACAGGAGGRTVRRTRSRVERLLTRAAKRCDRGRETAALGTVAHADAIVERAARRLDTLLAHGRVDPTCGDAFDAVLDGLRDALGASSATTTTTTSSTTTSTLVPLSADEKFVRQLFRVELGRDGTAAEWVDFTSLLAGGTPRADVVTAVQSSAEALQRLVDGFYQTYLGRPADAGAAVYVSALQTGTTDEDVLTSILASAEYYTHVGGGMPTNATFVAALYQQLLGRAPSSQETSYFVQLIAGSGRDAAVTAILGSTEWRTRVVSGFFTTLLGRAGTAGEVNAFVASWTGWRATRAAFEAGAEFYALAGAQP
jgi:hypothetical protein